MNLGTLIYTLQFIFVFLEGRRGSERGSCVVGKRRGIGQVGLQSGSDNGRQKAEEEGTERRRLIMVTRGRVEAEGRAEGTGKDKVNGAAGETGGLGTNLSIGIGEVGRGRLVVI